MRALHSIIESIAETIRLVVSFDLSGASFEIDAAEVDRDLSFGRS